MQGLKDKVCNSNNPETLTSRGRASSMRMTWYSPNDITPSPSVSKLLKKSLSCT